MRFLQMRCAKRLGPTLALGALVVGLTALSDSARALAGLKTATVSFGTIESVARAANGDTVTITYVRGGKRRTVNVTLASRPS